MKRRLAGYFIALFVPAATLVIGAATLLDRAGSLDGTVSHDVLVLAAAFLVAGGAVVSAVLADSWVRRELAALEVSRREARESVANLRLVLQSNPNAMLVVDRQGQIVDANPQAEKVFGYPPGTMRGMGIEQLVPARARPVHARSREEFTATAHARPVGSGLDLTACHADGSEFAVEISLAPLVLEGLPCTVTTVVDISARKRAEAQVRELNASLERRVEERTAALQRAEGNLRLLLESSANGLFGVDLSGLVTFANPAAHRLLGHEGSGLIGQAAAVVLGSGESDALRGLDRTLRDGEACVADDGNFRRASGGYLPVWYSVHPMVRDGQIVGAVVSFADVTERRALDEARERALREAEQLARARSEFLANMSHEIRTPLNGVLGLAQVGHREHGEQPAVRDTFARILESGRTLLGIVDNVLDFSRIEAGKTQVEAVVVELATVVDEVMTSIEPIAATKPLRLRVEHADDAPERCVTDPMRIKQVLLNLLSNAVKFTERGEVTLAISRAGDMLRFVVRDTGIGISDEQRSRIFRAFEQADTSTTRRFGGTGLGLAICKRIVGLMGGHIAVESEPGRGSAFTVDLPFVAPPGSVAELRRTDELDATGTRRVLPRLAGMRILLAEDNEVNQMVVQAMLRREGPEVVVVGNGSLAVDRVRAEGGDAFDVVLMDVQMPVMDGCEATRLIHEFAPDLPVIGQTAHVLHEAIEQCRDAGMVAHLPKPIDRHDLIAAIMRHARLRDQDAAGISARSA